MLNYLDRQVLSILAPQVQKDLGIDDLGYARIVQYFLVAYAIAYVAAGWVTDKLGAKYTLALFLGWWSLANMATGWVRNAAQLGFARMMLGIGELYDRLVDEEVVRFGTPDYRRWLFDEIDRRRAVATTAGSRFALTNVLCMRVSADAADVNGQLANDPDRLDWLNDTIRDYGADNDVDVVDLHGTVCANGYNERVDGVELRDDGLHLNQGGADLVWGQLGPLLVRASRAS